MLTCREDIIKERKAYAESFASQKRKILVCAGTGCIAGGSLDIHAELKRLMAENGLPCTVELSDDPHEHEESIGLKKSGCHGFCEMGPLVRIEPAGILYIKCKVDDCEEIVNETILNDNVVDRLVYHDNGRSYNRQEEIGRAHV